MTTRPRQVVEVKESKLIKKKPSQDWLKRLYDVNLIPDSELAEIYDTIRYQGFDREEMLAIMEEKLNDPKLVAELIILCSLRGPRAAENIKLRNGKTPKSLGIPASDQKGTTNISCSRISASTADLAAFFMKRIGVPKRIFTNELPSWLQFPTAGSIRLPESYRQQHIQFSREFSKLIGGEFNEQIYSQMVANAYLDEKLGLF
jgi:hypothetical protein